jgi:excisionase family DNA binding protein
MTDRALTVAEVAEQLAVGQPTVIKWIKSGELVAVNVARRVGRKPRWRISAQALNDFLLCRQPIPPPPKARRRKRDADVIQFY